MRVEPQVIRVRDFRSFSEEQVVNLAQQPGTLGLITGLNEAEPDLGANGTGKSTIWDALCWCLYGKTVRGLRGPALYPWGVDSATPRVQFTFEVEGHRYTISRTANPNGVRLFREAQGPGADTAGIDGEEMDQESINRMVGMDYDLFLSTVIRGQFADSFLELSPKKKMEFLSAALMLDEWDDHSKKAAEKRKSSKAELAETTRTLDRLTGSMQAREAALASSTEKLMAAEAQVQKSVVERGERLQVLRDRLEATAAVAAGYDSKIQKGKEAISRKKDDLAALKDKAEELHDDWQASVRALADANARESVLQDAVLSSESLGGTCPTCRSELSERARATAMSAIAMELSDATSAAIPFRIEEQTRETLYRDTLTRIGAMECSLDTMREELSDQQADLVRVQKSAYSLKADLENLSVPSSVPEEVLSAVSEGEKALKEVSVQRAAAADAVQQIEAALRELDFWVKGFQDIRLWLLRSALDELEALSNSHTLMLGLRGWRILYEVERETKSGSIAKGFRCLIQSPTNPDPVALESWSGGELQRLKLATQAAMCDLIRSRFGTVMALEVWDEPGQHLSSRGCADMMKFFRDRAATQGLEIWIVDHRNTASGDYDQQLVVTRNSKGTKVRRGHR